MLPALKNPAAIALDAKSIQERNDLVLRCQAIERVAGESSQQHAAALLVEVHRWTKAVEEDRKFLTRPLDQLKKTAIGLASTFLSPLEAEYTRLDRLICGFQTEQRALADAARKKQEAELAALRQQRAEAEAALNTATNEKQVAAAQEQIMKTDLKAAEAISVPVVTPPKADGIKVAVKWKVTVEEAAKLYAARPDLVNLVPKLREINAEVSKLAEANPEVAPVLPGCKIEKEVNVSPR